MSKIELSKELILLIKEVSVDSDNYDINNLSILLKLLYLYKWEGFCKAKEYLNNMSCDSFTQYAFELLFNGMAPETIRRNLILILYANIHSRSIWNKIITTVSIECIFSNHEVEDTIKLVKLVLGEKISYTELIVGINEQILE